MTGPSSYQNSKSERMRARVRVGDDMWGQGCGQQLTQSEPSKSCSVNRPEVSIGTFYIHRMNSLEPGQLKQIEWILTSYAQQPTSVIGIALNPPLYPLQDRIPLRLVPIAHTQVVHISNHVVRIIADTDITRGEHVVEPSSSMISC